MPIDFKQVAAPSFSDSNTLVALAAKQQQEAMTGIQGAWTGAMDAVGNRVQGEMEGIANQASFSQLTDPTQRAALDQQIMAANVLGMGDVKEINKYTDARRGVQLGLIDNVNRVDSAARNEADIVEQKRINDSSYLIADLISQTNAEEDKEKKKEFQRVGEQYLKDNGFTDEQKAKIMQLGGQHNQKQRLTDIDELTKMWGPDTAEARYNAINANTENTKLNGAIAADKYMKGDKGNALASKRKYADSLGLQGVFNNEGEVQYNVLMQKAVDTIAKSAQEQERVDPDNMSYDQYLIKNSDLMEQKLGSFGRKTDVKGLQSHFKWAEDNGVPYPEREKILITEGFLTGSIKMNLFTENFFDGVKDGAGNQRVKEAIANTHLPRVETEFNTKRMQAGQDAFGPIVDFLRSENIPPDEGLRKLGITSLDHPQAKYLPENYKKALELLITNDRAAHMAEVPDGTSVGKTRDQLAKEGVKSPDLDIAKLVGKGSPGSGVLANKTTEDLVAVGKANNVGKPVNNKNTPTIENATKKSTKNNFNGFVILDNKRTISHDAVTPSMVAAENKLRGKNKIATDNNGNAQWIKGSKPVKMMTVYGQEMNVKDSKSLNVYLGINQGEQGILKVKKGQEYIDGKLKYTLNSNLPVPDPLHPLANVKSDNLKHFVPYSKRNADGSAIYPKTQYPSYESQKKKRK